MQIERDIVVTVQYTLEVLEGKTPENLRKPFTTTFLFGRDRMLPMLEKALAGRRERDFIEITIPPEQAFGPYDENLLNEIPLDSLKYPERLHVGEIYEESTDSGGNLTFSVRKINENSVTADFNHPAAGKHLLMKIRITEVRAPCLDDFLASINAFAAKGG